jgi:squalene-hopene/tetraprenyl-beta-curcumene cyclase
LIGIGIIGLIGAANLRFIAADRVLGGADITPPTPSQADEPFAKSYQPTRAAAYLDSVAVYWTRERQCISCHTNMLYLAARPLLGGDDSGWREVRAYLEKEVQRWTQGGRPRGDAYVVVTACALALNDAVTTGKLHPLTRAALERMWQVQRPSGEWNWLKCDWPPLEHDDYYGAVLAGIAVGSAPEQYATTPQAQVGVVRLRRYLQNNRPPDLHHAAMLLWASTRLDNLLTPTQRQQIIADLKAQQRTDGSWALPALGSYKRRNGQPNDPASPGDGYATGMVTYILLQAGLSTDDPAIAAGLRWISQHQRTSGRWFTRSLNTDKAHYITNIGTAFCVLALEAGKKNASR